MRRLFCVSFEYGVKVTLSSLIAKCFFKIIANYSSSGQLLYKVVMKLYDMLINVKIIYVL